MSTQKDEAPLSFRQRRARRRALASPHRPAALALPPVRGQLVRSEDGTELHVETFGPADGPVVLLVHGWTCAIRFWNAQVRTLAKEFRVVAFDLRGHGRSGAAAHGDYGWTPSPRTSRRCWPRSCARGRRPSSPATPWAR